MPPKNGLVSLAVRLAGLWISVVLDISQNPLRYTNRGLSDRLPYDCGAIAKQLNFWRFSAAQALLASLAEEMPAKRAR